MDSNDKFRGDVVMASMVYNKTIRLLLDAVEDTHGMRLQIGAGSPTARFDRVVKELKVLLTTEASRRELAMKLDVESGTIDEISSRLVKSELDAEVVSEMDDITPNAVKSACYDTAYRHGRSGASVDVPLAKFLRDVLDAVFETNGFRGRMNVGDNRHFWRLLQYVRECEGETRWSDRDRGFWLKNAGGRGRVAEWPDHPSSLKLTIAVDWL